MVIARTSRVGTNGDPPDVVYNPGIPPEFFDFVIVDECHRSIYELWAHVLLYFDAFLIGLTAKPAGRTIGFFNKNLVMQYGHDEAVDVKQTCSDNGRTNDDQSDQFSILNPRTFAYLT